MTVDKNIEYPGYFLTRFCLHEVQWHWLVFTTLIRLLPKFLY